MLNSHSWMVLQETEPETSDVKHYSLPVEKSLSASVAPGTDLRPGSTDHSSTRTNHVLFDMTVFSSKNRRNQIFKKREIRYSRFCVGVNTIILTLGVFLVSRAEAVSEPQEIPSCVCTLVRLFQCQSC